uniref:hypothetical protein n=1 Tax=Umezakia ovalisporum TaxID=75695 RepID=UPI0039C6A936
MVMSYGTPYVAYMQGAQLIQKSYTAFYLINVLIYAVHPPIFAAMVYGLTKPRKESMIRIPVYNILTGEQVYYYEREYDSAGRKDYVKSDIYNFFYQMKREVAK